MYTQYFKSSVRIIVVAMAMAFLVTFANPSAGFAMEQGVVEGVIFHDKDFDGILDEGEEPLSGVIVTMVYSPDPALGGIAMVKTFEDGYYSFPVLAAGSYELLIDLNSLPEDKSGVVTGPLGSTPVFGISGDAVVDVTVTEDNLDTAVNIGFGTEATIAPTAVTAVIEPIAHTSTYALWLFFGMAGLTAVATKRK